MDENPQTQRCYPGQPNAMLAIQTQSLAELVELQRIQNQQIADLQRQNERMIGLLADLEVSTRIPDWFMRRSKTSTCLSGAGGIFG